MRSDLRTPRRSVRQANQRAYEVNGAQMARHAISKRRTPKRPEAQPSARKQLRFDDHVQVAVVDFSAPPNTVSGVRQESEQPAMEEPEEPEAQENHAPKYTGCGSCFECGRDVCLIGRCARCGWSGQEMKNDVLGWMDTHICNTCREIGDAVYRRIYYVRSDKPLREKDGLRYSTALKGSIASPLLDKIKSIVPDLIDRACVYGTEVNCRKMSVIYDFKKDSNMGIWLFDDENGNWIRTFID